MSDDPSSQAKAGPLEEDTSDARVVVLPGPGPGPGPVASMDDPPLSQSTAEQPQASPPPRIAPPVLVPVRRGSGGVTTTRGSRHTGANTANANGSGSGSRTRPARPPPMTRWGKIRAFLGHGEGNELRRELVNFIFKLFVGGVQIALIGVFVHLSYGPSPIDPLISQYDACDRPLGPWAIVWAARAGVGCIVTTINWHRISNIIRTTQTNTAVAAAANASTPSAPTSPTSPRRTRSHHRQQSSSASERPAQLPRSASSASNVPVPVKQPLSRLSSFLTFLAFIWFIVAHVFIYTTIDTCRLASPILWWLTFGILCLGYLVVLEVFLVGLLVFVIGPLLYLVLNIILLCTGRHPIQPGTINPDVAKLSQKFVDRIPLVFYIPPPPNAPNPFPPPNIHHYPPPPLADSKPRHRFAWFSRKKKGGGSKNKADLEKGKAANVDEDDWEANWVKGEHPFVALDGNRATCSICLMDFEEPVRRKPAAETPTTVEGAEGEAAKGDKSQPPQLQQTASSSGGPDVRLQDAGEGAQPLRLLACGHVFHKTCLDPWLVDVSGRCPVCQRPVEIEEPGNGRKSRRRRDEEDAA